MENDCSNEKQQTNNNSIYQNNNPSQHVIEPSKSIVEAEPNKIEGNRVILEANPFLYNNCAQSSNPFFNNQMNFGFGNQFPKDFAEFNKNFEIMQNMNNFNDLSRFPNNIGFQNVSYYQNPKQENSAYFPTPTLNQYQAYQAAHYQILQPQQQIVNPQNQTDTSELKNHQPQTTNNQPQTYNYQPQMINALPQFQSYQSQYQAIQPQTINSQPQYQTYQPQYQSFQPPTINPQPQTNYPQPRTFNNQPESQTTQPENQTYQPQTNNTHSQYQVYQPQNKTYKPQHKTSVPEYSEYKVTDSDNKSNLNGKTAGQDSLEKFRNECLIAHNEKRKPHHAPDLVFCEELNDMAQKYAESIAASGSFQHSKTKYKGEFKGENLFMQSGGAFDGRGPVESWYKEINNYDFSNPKNKKGIVGHFTQLVWKNSKRLGVGFARSSNGACYVVANYFPGGNYNGMEEENVLPQ